MKSARMVATIVLAFEMPVPIYWAILHSGVDYWRRHVRTGFLIAVAAAWGLGDFLIYAFRMSLFRPPVIATVALIAGLALMAFDVAVFLNAEALLGGRRIVGHAELTASGELMTRGIYTRVRHPRYLGMIAGVLGATIVLGSTVLWTIVLLWILAVLAMVRFEERELRARFGAAYADYASRVPALLPFRVKLAVPRQPR